MATKLPTPATQGPIRGTPRAAGSDSGLILASRESVRGASVSASMSATTSLRSRTFPALSNIPGFSLPALPYRTSFNCLLPVRKPTAAEPPDRQQDARRGETSIVGAAIGSKRASEVSGFFRRKRLSSITATILRIGSQSAGNVTGAKVFSLRALLRLPSDSGLMQVFRYSLVERLTHQERSPYTPIAVNHLIPKRNAKCQLWNESRFI